MTIETYQLILYTTPLELLTTTDALELFVLFFMLMIFFIIVVFFLNYYRQIVCIICTQQHTRYEDSRIWYGVRSLGSRSHGSLVMDSGRLLHYYY